MEKKLIDCWTVNNYSNGGTKYNLSVIISHTYIENGFVSNEGFLSFVYVVSLTLHLYCRELLCQDCYRFI